MIYWQNRILTNVKNHVSDICTNVVSTPNGKKPSFPALLVEVTSNTAIEEDFGGEENAVRCVVTIESYSKSSVNHARELITSADDAMRMMGFRRRQGPVEITNESLSDVFIIVARYTRVIGASETIPLL